MELSLKYNIILALQFFFVSITLLNEAFHQDNYRAGLQYVLVSFVMIYLESIVFDTSKNRILLCILN